GQKFRLRMQLGSLSSEVVLSFEEPWLFQRQLALGFSVFRTSSEYNSTFYSQIQTGFEVYLRKHLFELWNGRLSYTYEVFDINNISPSASAIIRALEGSNASSSIGFQLERDTRDKIINTTSGNRVEMNFRFAGGPLGGSKINNNYSMEFRGSQFFPIFETQAQVLALIARGGVIQNFGDSNDVPYYNKYYLGGPQTLRGYEFREVAPRDQFNEPIGGKTYDAQMVPMAMNDDEWIAAVTSYVRNSFGNKGALIFPKDVARIREEMKGITAPWTQETLQASLPPIVKAAKDWKVSASDQADTAQNGCDADGKTRWETKSDQKKGMWYQVELPAEQAIAGVRLDASGRPSAFPKNFKVEGSVDGKKWFPLGTSHGLYSLSEAYFGAKPTKFV
ncbi:MAG: hypothetical protein EBY80_16475, partial [Actinobacteria bacterium]|nr:hypothetical protein [Actinomycetota bacterium]